MRLSLDLGLGSVAINQGGYVFSNAEAAALVARFTTPPTSARKGLIDTLVGSLKTAGVWSKLDALYVMAAADAQAAQRNWIADAYNLSPVNGPTFVADRGYTGDGSSSRLDTGFNPTTAPSGKYLQNSASFSAWSRTADNITQAAGNLGSTILPSNGGNATIRVNNTGTASSGANASSAGFFIANRSASNAETLRRNGVAVITSSAASTGMTNDNFWLCGRGTSSFSTLQESAGHIGQSLSVAEQDALYTSLNTYMQAVGAA